MTLLLRKLEILTGHLKKHAQYMLILSNVFHMTPIAQVVNALLRFSKRLKIALDVPSGDIRRKVIHRIMLCSVLMFCFVPHRGSCVFIFVVKAPSMSYINHLSL